MASELFEIKKNNQGYGILIEKDSGYIDFGDERNAVSREQLNKVGSGEPGIEIVDRMKIFAVLQKHSKENANGRIYPKAVLERQVSLYQQLIDDRLSYGEVNHPESVTIDLDRVGMGVTKLWWEKNTLLGELELILSPGYLRYGVVSVKGDLIANYLRSGWKIGISSRGLGSVEQDRMTGKYIVQDDFELTCWDFVVSPSTNSAFCGTTVQELTPYIESKQNNKTKILEGLNNFLGSKNIL